MIKEGKKIDDLPQKKMITPLTCINFPH